MEIFDELQHNYNTMKLPPQPFEYERLVTKCEVNANKMFVALKAYRNRFQQISAAVADKCSFIPIIVPSVLDSKQEEIILKKTQCPQFLTILSISNDYLDRNEDTTHSPRNVENRNFVPAKPWFRERKSISGSRESKVFKVSATSTRTARPYQCAECEMAFKRNLHLKRHYLVSHTSKKNFPCHICGKLFSRKDYLDKHIDAHQKRKFKLKLLHHGIVVRTKMRGSSSVQK